MLFSFLNQSSAKDVIDVSNASDKKFGIKFELVTQNGDAFLRTLLAPFIHINKNERRGKIAGKMCLQAKLVELVNGATRTEIKDGYTLSFSGFVRTQVKKEGGYLTIKIGQAEVNGKKISFK